MFGYFSLGGIVPFFNFHRMQLVESQIQISYFAVCVLSAICIHWMALSEILAVEEMRRHIFMETILIMFSIACNFSTVIMSFIGRRFWEELLQRLADLESKSNLNTFQVESQSVIRSPIFSFIVHNMILGLFCYVQFLLQPTGTYFVLLYRLLHALTVHFTVFNINLLLIIIRDKYADIDELLWQSVGRLDTKYIRKCRILFRKLQTVVKLLNRLCGTTVFIAFFYSGYKLVYESTTGYDRYRRQVQGFTTAGFIIKIFLIGIEGVSIRKYAFVQFLVTLEIMY